MTRKIITIIPDMPTNWTPDQPAPWRNALGYPWQDITTRIPADDRPLAPHANGGAARDAILAELVSRHGPIAWQGTNSYGWLCSQILADDGHIYTIGTAKPVALVCCMWCGGESYNVYRVADMTPAKPKITTPAPAADQHGSGYCHSCKTYCHGDCGNYQPNPTTATITQDIQEDN